MPPIYVKPYVKRGKTDAADAEAICEAVTRPTMRFVAIKSAEQQSVLSLHRTRALLVGQRTQLVNMIRSQLAELGIVLAKGIHHALRLVDQLVEGVVPDIPPLACKIVIALAERGIEVSNETVRRWFLKFGRLQVIGGEFRPVPLSLQLGADRSPIRMSGI
jgi:transposase